MGAAQAEGAVTGQSAEGEVSDVIVPGTIKVEASNFPTKDDAAKAAGAAYGALGVKNKQEVQLGLLELGPQNWGYLTLGWGPFGAGKVDPSALLAAYRNAGFKNSMGVKVWMHGHWDGQMNFSATDFPHVRKVGAMTYLVNKGGEVRVLTHQDLKSAISGMRGSTLPKDFSGVQMYYKESGLPGRKL